ncbi:MAG: DNA-binding response regulator [Nitrosomonas sp.]|nr:MAG: DNA-binding response regulator [Nitrosomonas sp.]
MATKTESVLARISERKINNTNVLIVVDKYISGQMLAQLLEGRAYQIAGICTSSHEALLRIRASRPELILTDMNLTNYDGICWAQKLNLTTDNSNLFICFTEYASDMIIQQAILMANELGYGVSKHCLNEHRVNFEFCFDQYHDAKKTKMISQQAAPGSSIRIFLVDDQQIVLWGLEKLIENEKPKMEIVGKSTNISDAKRYVMEEQPDILIINLCLTDLDSIDCIADFANNGNTRVIIFTDTNDNDLIDQAVLNGARGVLGRKESVNTILRAIQKVHDGELWLDRITTGRIFLQSARIRSKFAIDADIEKNALLTRKECMILKAFSDGTGGEQNKQIAAKLCMSEHTLRNHLTSIFGKLGIKNRFSLFAYAKQHFQQIESTISTGEAIKEQ